MHSASSVVLEAGGVKQRFLAFFHEVLLLINVMFPWPGGIVLFEAGVHSIMQDGLSLTVQLQLNFSPW